MLDQLVESKSEVQGSNIRNALLLGTMIAVFLGFFGGLGYSLFAQSLGVGGEGLELSTLVAPPIPEEVPEPEPEVEPEKKQVEKVNADVRKEIIQNMNESPKVPDKISNVKSKIPPRRENVPTKIGTSNSNDFNERLARPTKEDLKSDKGTGLGDNEQTVRKPTPAPTPKKAAPPPPPPPKPKVPKRISKGVVNGSAISLPQPTVPAAARAVNAKGNVSVRIVISKAGRVISASAVSGHPLLRRAAASAARRAKFRPTLLSGQPVEVSGVIVYRFN